MTDQENFHRPTKSAQKKLNAAIAHVAAVIVACLVLMWSVFNFWLNVLAYRSSETPDQAWSVAGGMVLFTCVLPFVVGLWLLMRSLGKSKPK